MLIVPPSHGPHDEHPEHVAPGARADWHAELVYLPLQVCFDPLYEHVPFAILHERVQSWVDDVFNTSVHNLLHVFVAIVHVHE